MRRALRGTLIPVVGRIFLADFRLFAKYGANVSLRIVRAHSSSARIKHELWRPGFQPRSEKRTRGSVIKRLPAVPLQQLDAERPDFGRNRLVGQIGL